jgi:hypothetical protein
MTAPQQGPQTSDPQAFLGAQASVDPTHGAAVIAYVTQLVQAYTRGVGFANGVPTADLAAVILGASARAWTHPRQLPVDETQGAETVAWHAGFNGWSVSEVIVLDRYRVKAL